VHSDDGYGEEMHEHGELHDLVALEKVKLNSSNLTICGQCGEFWHTECWEAIEEYHSNDSYAVPNCCLHHGFEPS
jgi:hypothetical protein